ncbi:MAG TPA: aldolase [Pseudonocardiaceae bacterium]|nr:aldolase [Pseudonocardiaceae bacterium]
MPPRTALDPVTVLDLTAPLEAVDAEHARRYPGRPTGRQPVHTCYLPAGGFGLDTVQRWGERALSALRRHAATPAELADVTGLSVDLAEAIESRLVTKLTEEPIEDLRLDFEDGYGTPGDIVEDADAERSAAALAARHRDGLGPAGLGLRIKSLDGKESRDRAIRTLDVFLCALLDGVGGELPPGFAVTVPKVTYPAQVEVCVELFEVLEDRLGLSPATLRFEIQIETTQSIVDGGGVVTIPGLLAAGKGRISGLHFGPYDYTAACGLPAGSQNLGHPACDFARQIMQVVAAGTGVRVADGGTNVLPVGDAESVRHGWRVHAANVRRALDHGFYQGWDVHPHQLVTRFAVVQGYYLAGAPDAARRIASYTGGTTAGAVADEPASIAVLASFLLRALDCGAYSVAELAGATSLTVAGLRNLT